ncbi:MAG: carbamoyltransferase HypF [Candidatus Eisenbacteria sp.]|nr:carbamoyltransferase HypF [Candidatus Eisenbacteria bacterium]
MGRRLVVRGVVQGVGFRPFVYRLAHRHHLTGWVANSSSGVTIEVDGPGDALAAFEHDLTAEAPVLARIESIESELAEPISTAGFEIRTSEHDPNESTLICPDVAICPDCLAEFLDPTDRRYRYPFINCTNCGPRFSIIEGTPYDRPATSMRVFHMCERCQAEYDDPLDRRFHAQPNACSDCGPALELVMPGRPGEDLAETVLGRSYVRMPDEVAALAESDPSAATRWLLRHGAIVGVRGLGGFHIAADAANDATVRALREKKNRPAKPFALMCRSLSVALELAHVGPDEKKLLTSPWSPVVLLRKRAGGSGNATGEAARISEHVAPANAYLGIMLPYAPLHHLLFEDGLDGLIMTSANRSGEPIVETLAAAMERLPGITRTFLTHNREIVNRNDDSVVFVEAGRAMMSRRSRGYAPYPINLGADTADVLACGTELKNTFTLLKNGRAFVSPHIGDMENQATLDLYEEMVGKFMRWFRFEPAVVAHDLHPDYLATRFARDFADDRAGVEIVGVQHHHAHIASVMIENRVTDPVIGLALDGTGYGTDGKIWGGEFLVADLTGFERVGHIKYIPLPGGDAAIRHPYRVALSHLHAAGVTNLAGTARAMFGDVPAEELDLVVQQIEKGVNSIDTSSAGRLFDAASAILGVCHEITYEAQAAIELESLVGDAVHARGAGAYPYDITEEDETLIVDPSRTVRALAESVSGGDPRDRSASQFHETVVAFCREVCGRVAAARSIGTVALSGGVFQNRYLLARLSEVLASDGLRVLVNREVPTNDGGVSLGQAIIASERARAGIL